MLQEILKEIFGLWLVFFLFPPLKHIVKFWKFAHKAGVCKERSLPAGFAVVPHETHIAAELLLVESHVNNLLLKAAPQELPEIKIEFRGERAEDSRRRIGVGIPQLRIIPRQVIDGSGKFNNVIDPPLFLAKLLADACQKSLISQGLPAEIVIPGFAEKDVILEHINVPQNVIKNHHVKPISVVLVVRSE